MRLAALAPIAAAILALSPALPAAPAHAEEMSAVVPLRGVDFGDNSQLARLHQAVLKTAEALCRKSGMNGVNLRKCIRETTDNAISGNPSPELKAYHHSLALAVRYAVGK